MSYAMGNNRLGRLHSAYKAHVVKVTIDWSPAGTQREDNDAVSNRNISLLQFWVTYLPREYIGVGWKMQHVRWGNSFMLTLLFATSFSWHSILKLFVTFLINLYKRKLSFTTLDMLVCSPEEEHILRSICQDVNWKFQPNVPFWNSLWSSSLTCRKWHTFYYSNCIISPLQVRRSTVLPTSKDVSWQ